MPQRPPQGRGSGGRVTPSAKKKPPSSSAKSSPSNKTRSSSSPAKTTADKAAPGKTGTDTSAEKPTPATPRARKGSAGPEPSTTDARDGGDAGATETAEDAGPRRGRVPSATPKAAAKAARRAAARGDGSGSDEDERPRRSPLRVAERTADDDRGRKATRTAPADPDAPKPPLLRTLFAPPGEDYIPPKERERPWWGMGDMVVWFLVAQVAAAIVYYLVVWLGGYSPYWPGGQGAAAGEVMGRIGAGQSPSVTKSIADLPLWISNGLLEIPLWAGFLGGPLYAVWRKGISLKEDFGLSMEWMDIPFGLAIGVFCQLVVVWLIYKVLFVFIGDQDVSAAARSITDKATSPLLVVFLVVVVGFLSPLFEELFFRGLSQRSIINRIGPGLGVVASAAFFAVVHGQLLQLPALFVFGLILGGLAHRYGRLGPSIWAHIGFNLVTVVALVGNLNLP
jgi:membrane protease YdiL (CAAX protease family)